MLERISIKNYAIIEELSLDFYSGFSVFTGETGAGKSILMGALSLLLGSRSDFSLIRTGAEILTVEGEFSINNPLAQDFLRSQNIDDPQTIIIRREMSRQGKVRIFINGNQETLSKLEIIGRQLSDIHGQHDHQQLLNKKLHIFCLDNFSSIHSLQKKFANIFEQLQTLSQKKEILEENLKTLKQESEFYSFAHKEIDTHNFHEDEEAQLESDITQMSNKEQITEVLNNVYNQLYLDEINCSFLLGNCRKILDPIVSFSDKFEELSQMLDDALTKTSESSHLLQKYLGDLDFDSQKMDDIVLRMQALKDIKRKYNKFSIKELQNFADECRSFINNQHKTEAELDALKKEHKLVLEELKMAALALSKARRIAALELKKKIKEDLEFLGMKSCHFEVKISQLKDLDSPLVINEVPLAFSKMGIDIVEFMISTNSGEPLRPLAKIASGGEISRILLAIKSVLAAGTSVETNVFDEIDAGIGGLVANNLGLKLRELSYLQQILCITHLAQIASKADHHYIVKKENRGTVSTTSIQMLQKTEDKVKEIARMLGGESTQSELLAQEMLESISQR